MHDLAGEYKKTSHYTGESSIKTRAKNSIYLLTKGHSKFYFHLRFVKVTYDSLAKNSEAFSLVTGSRVCEQLEQDQISGERTEQQ